jgi:hypothetical protein
MGKTSFEYRIEAAAGEITKPPGKQKNFVPN